MFSTFFPVVSMVLPAGQTNSTEMPGIPLERWSSTSTKMLWLPPFSQGVNCRTSEILKSTLGGGPATGGRPAGRLAERALTGVPLRVGVLFAFSVAVGAVVAPTTEPTVVRAPVAVGVGSPGAGKIAVG